MCVLRRDPPEEAAEEGGHGRKGEEVSHRGALCLLKTLLPAPSAPRRRPHEVQTPVQALDVVLAEVGVSRRRNICTNPREHGLPECGREPPLQGPKNACQKEKEGVGVRWGGIRRERERERPADLEMR